MQTKFNLFTTIFIILSLNLYSQNKMATINGLVKNKIFTYAYLYNDESKLAKVSKIENEQFKFQVVNEKELKMYRLFLGSETSVLPENQIQYRSQDPTSYRLIALENMNVNIVDGIKTAVIEGGELNKAVEAMGNSIKKSEYDKYFLKFPDSPVSVFFLKLLVKLNNSIKIGPSLNVDSFYSKLSERIKNSDEGKLLYASIFK